MQPETVYDLKRQFCLDAIHRYLQRRTAKISIWRCWAEDRDRVWQAAWRLSGAERLREADAPDGQPSRSSACDPRRFARLMDALSEIRPTKKQPEAYRKSVARYLHAYNWPNSGLPECDRLDYRAPVHLFERPLPDGGEHRYPGTLDDIRQVLAAVPEHDIEGIWAIGLAPAPPPHRDAYGVYYRSMRPMYKPVIMLHSSHNFRKFALHRSDPGYTKHNLLPEQEFGMRIVRRRDAAICFWPDDALRNYMFRHVLLHEIGHHVQYQQRWRASTGRHWLPRRQREQFAEDYAIRFNRGGAATPATAAA